MHRRILLFFLIFFCIPALAKVSFLTISDIHYSRHNPTGDGHNTGDLFLQITLNQFRKYSHQADFIINLGDMPTHSLGHHPYKKRQIRTVLDGLYHANNHNKPMFYIPGNNDSLQGNYQAFRWKNQSPIDLSKLWQSSCIHCRHLPIDQSHMTSEGYYSTYVLPNNHDIVLIALNSTQFANTPYYYPKHPQQNTVAQRQLAWLEQQLKSLHAKQLLIATHIPPGINYQQKPMWRAKDRRQFVHLLSKYHAHFKQITILSAHTHIDEIRRIHLTDGAHIYDIATPSISRVHHNYPSMKMFYLDDDDRLKNFVTYYTRNERRWGNEFYQALGTTHAIFPQCSQQKTLVNCLNKLRINHIITDHSASFPKDLSPRKAITIKIP